MTTSLKKVSGKEKKAIRILFSNGKVLEHGLLLEKLKMGNQLELLGRLVLMDSFMKAKWIRKEADMDGVFRIKMDLIF